MFYLIWIPIIVIFYAVSAWLSLKNNVSRSSMDLFLVWLLGIVPVWAFFSRFSKSILFDSIVYDIVMTIAYTLALVLLTKSKLHPNLIAGAAICVIGLILMKVHT